MIFMCVVDVCGMGGMKATWLGDDGFVLVEKCPWSICHHNRQHDITSRVLLTQQDFNVSMSRYRVNV
jgi:hypothetical protein